MPPSDSAPPVQGVSGPSVPRLRKAASRSFWRRLAGFCGPGYLIAVGYMDPGNWATGIAAGSAFGYRLLSVIVLANLVAMVLQSLTAKLAVATGLDLAQACRRHYKRPTVLALWVLCEAAIIACELAEVIGAAIALKLLFHLPLPAGIGLTAIEALLFLGLQRCGMRWLEAFVITLIAGTSACFAAELAMSRPPVGQVAAALVPSVSILTNPAMLYLAVGILGATVMPHNLYLHSAMVRDRASIEQIGSRQAVRFAVMDVVVALGLAIFVNGAILVLAASAFHASGQTSVAGLEEAYRLLSPTLGAGAASTIFAIALLACGQNASITGALAGQVVMEGFTDLRWPAWARRLGSRALAIVPAGVAAVAFGDLGLDKLLIFSQVALSLQLPFAVIPLVHLTSNSSLMGPLANRGPLKFAAWTLAVAVPVLNLSLVGQLL